MKDHYKNLGVDRKASVQDIRDAWKEFVRENHPDKHPGDKKVEARFKEVSGSYEILKNPKSRALHDMELDAYDRLLRPYATSARPGTGYSTGRRPPHAYTRTTQTHRPESASQPGKPAKELGDYANIFQETDDEDFFTISTDKVWERFRREHTHNLKVARYCRARDHGKDPLPGIYKAYGVLSALWAVHAMPSHGPGVSLRSKRLAPFSPGPLPARAPVFPIMCWPFRKRWGPLRVDWSAAPSRPIARPGVRSRKNASAVL